jgi:hypothetical protein
MVALGLLVALSCGCTTSVEPSAGPSPALSQEPRDDKPSAFSTPSPPAARAASQQDWFEDITEKAGVRFTYQNGRSAGLYTLLETVGGGVAMFDYDRDGDMDLFFPGGGSLSASPPATTGLPSGLFRNEGAGAFRDVTQETGLANAAIDYSHGCAVGDYDRDGYQDLFVTCYGRSRLYRNEEGRRFRDVTEETGVTIDAWSTAATWVDQDGDGWLDLYVAGYLDWKLDPQERCGDLEQGIRDVCVPQRYPPSRERLFRNQQGKRFTEVSQEAGLLDKSIGLGAVAADFNQDGHADLYVGNDVMRNYLYLGGSEGRWRETAILAGTAFNEYGAPEGSMGVDVGDFDGDADLDLFVANYQMEDNSLYRNEGNDYFSHATVSAGLAGACRPLVGFGTGFADFDSDGWLDLFVINGHVLYHTGVSSYEQPSFLFRNQHGVFQDVSAETAPYFSAFHAGRGAAVGDLDNDGALDLVVVHQNHPVVILRNRRPPKHWLGVQLQGQKANIDAVGAVVTAEYDGRKLVRVVRGGGGYLSHFDSRIVVPRDDDAPASILVCWPGGALERFSELRGNQYRQLVEGHGEPTK